uniref:Uncharacterized protein n=1 Tax=Anguilla anguilla TaxID=7936 RepID=A0A0E9XN98_ANGAN
MLCFLKLYFKCLFRIINLNLSLYHAASSLSAVVSGCMHHRKYFQRHISNVNYIKLRN